MITQGEAGTGDAHKRSGFDAKILQLDATIEAVAEFGNDPFASALVDVAGTEIKK